MSTLSLTTVKRLFAVSGNRCAFPGCQNPLIEETGTVTGEICHIVASNQGGPRFNENLSASERDAYGNLILLCSRHHKIVDSEPEKYSSEILQGFKRGHVLPGPIEISQATSKAAQSLLDKHLSVVIHSNTGQIAIHSPGAIQAQTVTFKTTKPIVSISPPQGSIAGDRAMLSYAKYLIGRYQEFQKADVSKSGSKKYILIHNALKREFKCDWKLLPTARFEEVVAFLQYRINNTKQGRIQRAKENRNYHSFEEHE